MRKLILFSLIFLSSCNFDDNPPIESTKEGLLLDNEYENFVLSAFSNAVKDIKVIMFAAIYFPDRDYEANKVFQLLNTLHQKGINVKLILDKTTATDYPESTNFLTQNNIDFKLYNSSFSLHSKMIIIDDKIVIFGSHNWTEAAFLYNKEISFYTTKTEIIERVKNYFNGLYNEIK